MEVGDSPCRPASSSVSVPALTKIRIAAKSLSFLVVRTQKARSLMALPCFLASCPPKPYFNIWGFLHQILEQLQHNIDINITFLPLRLLQWLRKHCMRRRGWECRRRQHHRCLALGGGAVKCSVVDGVCVEGLVYRIEQPPCRVLSMLKEVVCYLAGSLLSCKGDPWLEVSGCELRAGPTSPGLQAWVGEKDGY